MRIYPLTKIGILLLGILLVFFTACETENEVFEENLTTRKQGYSINRIKFSEFESNIKLVETLSELNISFKTKKYSLAKRSNSSEQTYHLNTEEVIYIENSDGTQHSYTFNIELEEDNFNLENIVLSSQRDGTYKAYLTTYTLTEQELIDLKNGINIDLTDQSSIQEINYNQINLHSRSGCSFELITIYTEMACSIDGCWEPEWTTWGTMHVWGEVCSGGGGNGSGDGNGDGSGSGSGGGGGSGGSGNNNNIPTIPMYPDGTSAVPSFLINLLGGESQLSREQITWINNHDNDAKVNLLLNYSSQSSMSNTNFISNVINALIETNVPEPTLSDYPGKNDGLPFEWWLNQNFVANNFSFNLGDEGIGVLTKQEKLLVVAFPVQALIIRENIGLAEAETQIRFGINGRNDKSDAFRHAFFNAMNSNDAGDTVARLFSTAHESEVSANLILEVQMDLHNNDIGHTIGADASFFVSDQDLSNSVYSELLAGNLFYLSPLDLIVPPNYGINSSTQLTPTNQ